MLPPGGPSPVFPSPRTQATQRICALGDTLYVADAARGLVVVDASSASAPQLDHGVQLAGGAEWVSVMGDRLIVVGPKDREIEHFEDSGPPSTRVLLFDVSEPTNPILLDERPLVGRLREVRESEQQLLVVTEDFGAGMCAPVRPLEGGAAPSNFVISAMNIDSDAIALSAEQTVAGQGYLSTDNGFLVTQGAALQTSGSVTAVDTSVSGELQLWPTLPVEGLLRSAPVRIDAERSWFVSAAPEGPVFNRATESGTGEVAVDTLALPQQVAPYDGVFGAIDERFAVFPAPEEGTGVVIDVETFTQVAEVPDTWRYVNKLGEHWFGCDATSAFVFEISDSGEIAAGAAVETPLAISTGRSFPPAHWDSGTQRLFVPYREQQDGNVVASHVGALDFSGTELQWLGGSDLYGEAQYYSGNSYGFDAFTQGERFYALTQVGGDPVEPAPALLESFSLRLDTEAEVGVEPQATELGALPEAVAVTSDYEVRLQRGPDRLAHVDVLELDGASTRGSLQLRYAAEKLLAVEGAVLAVSTHYTNECSPTSPGGFGPCFDTFRPAVTVIEFEPEPHIVHEVLLPTVTVAPRADITLYSWEWLEVVQQGAHFGLLQHRGYECSTVAACEELNTPYEMLNGLCDDETGECDHRLRGNTDEQWYYPFDRNEGVFGQPYRVGNAEGHDYITARGISSDESLNFLAFTTVQQNPDGLHADVARFELVHAPSNMAQPRITLPGFPLRVAEPHVVSIAPSSPLTSEAAVGVNVQVSELFEGNAYLVDTLALGHGHQDSRWAEQRGYVLLTPDDRCADPKTEVVAIELDSGSLHELGRLELPGVEWRIAAASDERLVLERRNDLQQYAELAVTEDGLSLGDLTTVPEAVPVAVSKEQVRLGAEADRTGQP